MPTNFIDIYKAARAEGQDQVSACNALMAAGLTLDQAADLCWRIETGKPAPAWLDEAGRPTAAAREWEDGHTAAGDR